MKKKQAKKIWLKWDSNRRPLGYKSSALPSELFSPIQ